MNVDPKIKGIQAHVDGNILVIESKTPMHILSSAIYNGGLKDASAILNIQVPEGLGSDKKDEHWNPDNFLNEQVQKLHLNKDQTVALMTAAKMQNLALCTEKCGKTHLTVFATAGKTVAVTAGEPAASKGGNKMVPGTINIILLVDGDLTEACMVEAIKTLTEAKTVALRELDLRSQFSTDLATGTLTDSVVVGCTKRGEVIQFAGTFTLLGELIGKCVRQAVKEAMLKQEKLASDRPLLERLAERGITTKTIMLLANGNQQKKSQLQKQVELFLSDPELGKLVLASLRLDEDLAKNLVPKGSREQINPSELEEVVMDSLKSQLADLPLTGALGPYTRRLLLAIARKAESSIA